MEQYLDGLIEEHDPEYNIEEEYLESSLNSDSAIDPATDVVNDEAPDLFNIKLKVLVKEFVSQRGGRLVITENISCASVEEFLNKSWEKVVLHVKRETVHNDETGEYEWATNGPTFENMDCFVSFQPSNSKRHYESSRISTTILHHWTGLPDVVCFVFAYGRLIYSKTAFSDIQKKLIQPEEVDRAGAASNMILFATMARLKEKHPY